MSSVQEQWRRPQGVAPIIIGHRGDRANAPENTMASFDSAIAKGAAGLEFDVRNCKPVRQVN